MKHILRIATALIVIIGVLFGMEFHGTQRVGSAGFAAVQTAPQTNPSSASPTVTLSSPTTQGNLVVVHWQTTTAGRNINSVTDNVGNTYVVAEPGLVPGVSGLILGQAYGVQVTGGATVITVNLNSSANSRLGADEYSGGASTNAAVFDVTKLNTSSSGGQPLTSGSFDPAASGELIVATMGIAGADRTFTAGSGYTVYSGAGVNIRLISEYKLSGATPETATATHTSTSNGWAVIATAFKAAPPPAIPITSDIIFFE